jgi:hypothetical protein
MFGHRHYDLPIAPSDEHPTVPTPPPSTSSDPSTATAPVASAASAAEQAAGPDDRVAPLRGAGVQIDGRRVAQVVLGIVLVTLAVLAVLFTVIGIHNNRQTNELHDQGVPVTVTVTSCQALIAGSGSNVAGFSCAGSYELDGHRYDELLPGTAEHAPGDMIRAVAVPTDPTLVSPVSVIDNEHASDSVFILPAVLLVVFVAIVVVLLLRRRHSTRPEDRAAD